MSRRRAIWLVARRELLERGKSRAFLLSLLLTQGLIIGSFVVQALVAGDRNVVKLGTVGDLSRDLRGALQATTEAYAGTLSLVDYPDVAAAEVAVRDDKVSGVIVAPSVASGGGGAGEFLVKDRPDSRLQAIVVGAYQLVAQPTPIPVPTIRSLDPKSPTDQAAFLLANVGVVLLFVSIFSFGYWVLSGVVEEKQSRVVEVILSTVHPRDLLMGKVLGIGLLGMAQLVVFVASGLIIATVTKRFELPPTTGPAVAMLILWFVLGYAIYSTAFAVLGALASRMEEASNATTPVTMVATGTYLVSLLVVVNDPEGIIARVGTLLPVSAPIIVPLRAALGAIGPWEVILAAVLTIGTTYALFVFGGRVYSGAALRGGGRVKLRDAWRAAGE